MKILDSYLDFVGRLSAAIMTLCNELEGCSALELEGYLQSDAETAKALRCACRKAISNNGSGDAIFDIEAALEVVRLLANLPDRPGTIRVVILPNDVQAPTPPKSKQPRLKLMCR